MFSEIVVFLVKDGLTELEIGERVGVSQPTINRIKRGCYDGRRVSWDVGQALISLRDERRTGGNIPQ
jgi:predicted transcriptional regulator